MIRVVWEQMASDNPCTQGECYPDKIVLYQTQIDGAIDLFRTLLHEMLHHIIFMFGGTKRFHNLVDYINV